MNNQNDVPVLSLWNRYSSTWLSGGLRVTILWIIALTCCASVATLDAAVVATDNFDRPDGPIGTNWSYAIASQGTFYITNNTVTSIPLNEHVESFWSSDSFNDNQFAQASISSIGPFTGVILRADGDLDTVYTNPPSGSQFYMGFVFGPNDYRIYHWINNAYYQETVGTTETWQTNDILRVEISGSVEPLVTMYRNGKPVLLWLITDAADVRTGGSPGLCMYSRDTDPLTIDNWEGGNLDPDITAPTAPTDLAASAVSWHEIDLSWTPGTDNVGVVGYLVERSQGVGSTNFFLLDTPTGTNYSDNNATTRYTMYTTNSATLLPNTTYNYRLRATDAAGNLSTYSQVATIKTPDAPPPTISTIPDQTTLTGIAVGPFPFSVFDPGIDPYTLIVTATSSDQTLLPDQNISIFNLGSTRALTMTPAEGQSGTATITVTVSNGATSTNTSFLLTVNPPGTGTDVFANPTNIVIPLSGASTPYPSTIDVSGEAGTITKLTVTLHSMSHTYPGDVNVLLVGPGGQGVVLMSDTVGPYPMTDLTFTLSDGAYYPLPIYGALLTGTFQPTDYAPNHTVPPYAFPAPAPAPPYTTNLSTFNGLSPNGSWSLYVFNGGAGDSGQISGGWSLAITTVSAPTIQGLSTDQSTPVNTPTAAIPFEVGDAQTAASNLVLSAISSDPSVINAASDITFGGSNSNRTITLTPQPNKIGTSTISVIVTDSDGMSATNSFLLTVSQGQLTVTGITASNKTYDGTTSVSLNTNGYALAGQGLVATPAPDVSLDASGLTAQFSDPNAANGKTVTVSGLTLFGANAGNYVLTQPTLMADITKANPTIVVTPYSVTYDGAAHTATGTAKGVLNENLSGLLLTGTTHTAAGTYTADPWTFTDSTGNYNNAAGSVNDAIAKANPTIVVTPYSVTYDGAAHTATGTAKGVLNENLSGLLLTGTTHTAAGSYTADPWTFTDSTGNYNNAAGSVNDAIATAALTVTPDDATRGYGKTNPVFTVSYNGFVNNEGSGVLGGTLAVSSVADTNSPTGTYPITASGLTSVNYLISYPPGTLTVTNALLSVTASNTNKIYGQTITFAGTEFTVSGLLSTDHVASVTLSSPGAVATAGVAGSPYTIDVTNALGDDGLTNYLISYLPGTLTLSKADPIVTVTPYSVTYDGSAHTATGSAKGVLNEDLSGLLLTGTTHTAAGSYTADPWTFTDSTGNYNNTAGSVNDAVAKANPTIVVTPYSVTYDGSAHTATGSAKGVLNENLSGLLLTGTTHTAAGSYTADPWTFTDSTGNYNNAAGSVNDAIAKASPTIVVTPYSVTYDGSAHTATGTAKGVLNENLSGLLLTGTTHTAAGTYTADAWTFTDSTGNYNNGAGSVNDAIATAALTVTPDDATRGYGKTNPVFTVSYNGFVNNEGSGVLGGTLAVSSVADTNSPTGTYPITASGLTSVNYLISYPPGTLTVTNALLSVTASNTNKIYGQTITFAGTEFTVSGLLSTDHVASVSLSSPGAVATAGVAGSPYTIDVTNALGDDSLTNYLISYLPGTLTLSKADPIVTVTPYSVTYDGAAHTATGSAKGVLNEDLSGLLLTGTTHTAAGSYTGDPWTFTDSTGNYNNTAGSVNDAVAKANPTIVVTPYSVTYDGAAHTATGTAKGVLNENLSGLLLTGTTHTAAGTYTADPWTFTDSTGNYNNAAGSVNDAIATAALTVTPDDATRGYGKTNPVFTVSYNGFVNNEGSGVLGGTLAVSSVADTNSPTGTYPITASGLTSVNYLISYPPGTLTVTNALLSVTASNTNKIYGQTITFAGTEFIVSGLLSTDHVASVTLSSPGAVATAGVAGSPYTIDVTNALGDDGLTNYLISYLPGTLTLSKADPIVTVTPYSVTYDGAAHTATGTAKGVLNENLSGLLLTGTTHTAAGTYTADPWTFTDSTGNYNNAAGSVNDAVAKANPTIVVTPYSVTYDGAAHTATGTAKGVLNENLSGLLLTGTTHTAAGTYTADPWTFTDSTGNYNNAAGSVNDAIAKANPTIVVTPYSVTYDGAAHTATGTAKGVLNENLSGLVLTGTTHTAAGTYTADPWTFTDSTGNYNNAAGSVNDAIAKANPTIVVTPYSVTYDGAAHSATGTAKGVLNENLSGLLLTGTTHTAAGTYTADPWTFTDSTGNYNNAAGSVNDAIAKANPTIVVTPYSVTYDGAAHTATGTTKGVLNENLSGLLLTGTTHTAAGTYTADPWTFTDSTGNYNNAAGSVNDAIATAALTVTPDDATRGYGKTNPVFTVSYNGFVNNEGSGVLGGTLVVSSPADTNSPTGTYPITASGLTSVNYLISYPPGTLTVTNALLSVTASNTNKIYGQTITFAGTEFTVSGLLSTDHVASVTLSSPGAVATAGVAGSPYTIDVTNALGDDGLTNYLISYLPGTLTLSKADPIVTVTPYSVTYDGAAHTATGTAKGVLNENLSGLLLTGTTHTAAGTYTGDPWTFTDSTGNYNNAAGSVNDAIAKANPTIVVTPYSVTYDGSAHTATGTAKGVLNENLSGLLLTGTTHTAAGTYTADSWTFTDSTGNYNNANGSVNDAIAKANPTIVVTPYSVTYDGAAHTATGTAKGVLNENLSGLLLTGTTHTAAGTYTADPWTFTDSTGNYNNAAGSVNDAIATAALTVTPDDATRGYGKTNPVFTVSYNGFVNNEGSGVLGGTLAVSSVADTNSPTGAYPITASGLTSVNYLISYPPGTLTVTNALLSVTASNTNKIYGQTITFAGTEFTVSGLLSTDHVASVTLSSPGAVATAGVAGSPYTIDVTNALGDDGLTNYLISYLPGTLTLSKADPIVTVTPYSVTYDGAAHTATGTAKGVLNENLSGLLLTGTTHTAAGTYTADAWTFTDSTGNYNNANGSVNDAIAKANPTIVVTPYSVTYDGAAHTATGTAKGVLNENLSGLLLTGTTHTAAGSYTADPWTFTDSTGNYNNAAGSVNDAIAKANPTIVVTPYSVTYDGAAHTATGTAKGVLNENLSGLLLTGTTHTAAGSYTADPWTFTDSTGNYNNAAGSVNDAIATAALTVTPDDATRGYGKTNPVFTVSYNGFVNNEGSGVLGGTLAVSSVADTNSPTGTYPITASGLTSVNYLISYPPGTLTVTNALLSVTASNTNKIYGQTITFAGTEFTVSGLLSTDHVASVSLSSPGAVATAGVAGSPYTIDVTNALGDDGLTNYLISYLPGTLTLSKADPIVTVTPYSVTYDGSAHTATGSAKGVLNEDLSGLLLTGTTHTAAGSYTADPWTFTDSTGNYNNTAGSVNDAVAKANPTIVVTPYSVTYDGSAHTATGSAKGVLNENLSGLLLTGTTHTAAGSYTADPWTFTDSTGNYNNANGSVNDAIAKANPTIVVTPYSVTYDGAAHTATGTAKGVLNENLSGLLLTGTTHTAAGTYTADPWTFTDSTGNYNNAAGSVNDAIAKASPTIVVTPYSVTYDGAAHTATGTAKGVLNENLSGLVLTGTTHTAAGTYTADPWTFTDSTGNYNNANGSVNDAIATAALTVTPDDASRGYGKTNPVFTVSYNGFVNGQTNNVLGGTLAVSSAADTNSPTGTYPISASGLTSANYLIAYHPGTLTVSNALLTVTASNTNKTYGQTITFGGTEFTVSGLLSTDHVASVSLTSAGALATAGVVGSPYTINITNAVGDGGLTNYLISYVPGTLTLGKANPTIVVTPYSVTYDGAAHTATGSAKGVLNENLSGLVLSGTTHTAAGSYTGDPWTFTDSTGNYNNANGSVNDAIAKANPTIVVTPYSVTYDGAAHTATGTAKGVLNENLSGLLLTGTTHTAAGTYTADPWTFTDSTGNYNNANGSVNDAIAKANPTIVVTPYSVTYDGAAHTATGTAKGVLNENLSGLLLTGTTHTAAGSYTADPWTFTDSTGNYNNTAGSVNDAIATAALTVTPDDASRGYGKTNPVFTVSYNGFVNNEGTGVLGGTLAVSSPADTNSPTGTYFITASGLTSVNYLITYHRGTLTVTNALLSVTASNTNKIYGQTITFAGTEFTVSGLLSTDHVASVTLSSAGAVATAGVAGSPYTIDVTNALGDDGLTNYLISYLPGTLTVSKADPIVTVTPYSVTYNGSAHTATGTAKGVLNENLSGLLLTGTTHTAAGSYTADPWTFTDSTGNYNNANGSVNDAIAKANPTIVVTPYSVTYNGSAHTATGTAKGVLNENLSGLLLTGTTHTAAGTYTADPWTFTDSTGNYNNANGSVNDAIAKANPTIVVTPYSVTYDGAAHTATGTAKGVLNENLSGLLLTGTTHTAAGSYTADPWTFTDSTGNYNNAAGSVNDAIATAALTVAPDAASRGYGKTNPVFTVSYHGFVNNEGTGVLGGTLVVSSPADTNSPTGTYPITASGLTSVNYLISYPPGTLTVTNALLSVTASNTNKIYGQTITFAGTEFTVSGLLSTDHVASVTLSSPGAVATAGVAGSPYTINVTNALGDNGLTNYLISYLPGTLTVNPAQSITAITSSLNPSQLGQTVTFTVRVTPVLPATTTPTGTIQFYMNGMPFNSPVPLNAGVATLSTSLLPQGSSTVISAYLNDPNFLTSADSLVQVVTIETPMTLGITNNGNGTVTVTFKGTPGGQYFVQATDDLVSMPWSTISTNIAGPDGLWTITESTANHVNRFFRSSLVQAVTLQTPVATSIKNAGIATVTVTFKGTPGGQYIVQATDDLVSMPWSTISTNIAGPDGSWTISESTANHVKRFFRASLVPAGIVLQTPMTLGIKNAGNGTVTVSFKGTPGGQYFVEATDDLVSLPWSTISTNIAGPDGSWTITESTANHVKRFFRASLVPADIVLQTPTTLGIKNAGNGTVTVSFKGTPGGQYFVEATDDLVSVPWLNISTNIAGPDGLWTITESTANHVKRFFRASLVPADITLQAPMTLGIKNVANGKVTVTFKGTPGGQYFVEATDDLVSIPWLNISTNIAGPDGLWTITESTAIHVKRFFRASLVPSDIVLQTPTTLGIKNAADGTVTVTFKGTPGGQYFVEATDDLVSMPWLNISTNIAGPDGLWTITEPTANHVKRFFRAAMP